ncbi:MAG: FG-GAP-like repeat-containing protein [Bacteroidetes bacterium]|nr:FG-GAP-like repeat-containing protein [Bacteroidota bacterium]
MRKLLSLVLLLLFTGIANNLSAQTQPFELVQNTGLPDLAHSWVSWGDYDRDGDLDVAICGDSAGIPRTYVYRNDNGLFINSGFALPHLTNGSIEWGDADNNGWLDLLITGNDAGGDTKAYVIAFSNGSPVASAIPLPYAVSSGQAHWGDYDNDGRLDILMAGNNIAKILHNNGCLGFSEIAAPLPALTYASCNWVDYNNDGQTDVFVCGHVDVGDVSKLFRNDHGVFTEVSVQPSGILGLSLGSSKWADLDRDGDMDLLISGVDTAFGYLLIYKNKGNDVFEQIDNYTFNLFSTNMGIADYDNDGRPDFIVNGKVHSCGGSAVTFLYHNEGDMVFNNFYTDMGGIGSGGTAFADYNNDGFTDLLMSGTGSYGETATRLYRNTSGTSQFFTNTPPVQPANLSMEHHGNTVTLKWDKAIDAQTPSDGLMYNMFIGSGYDSIDVLSPMSDCSTGFRRIACTGNTNQDTSWTINGLVQGTYYWSVQAIDNGFLPSAFSTVHSFDFTPTAVIQNSLPEFSVYPNPCQDRLFLNFPHHEDMLVMVYDIRGVKVIEQRNPKSINVSGLPSGLYLLRLNIYYQSYQSTFLKN